MNEEAFDTSNIVEEECIAEQRAPIEPASLTSSFKETVYKAMSTETLVKQCSKEIENYRSGEPWNKDIVNSYPQEFHDLREISRLRHSILQQLSRHLDCLED